MRNRRESFCLRRRSIELRAVVIPQLLACLYALKSLPAKENPAAQGGGGIETATERRT
jgi:hypothetical protein